MAKLTIQTAPFQNAVWSSATLDPGTEATLKVDAPKIRAGQNIDFRIFSGNDLIDVISGADAQQSVKWKVPNLPHQPTLKFDAVLREKPGPKNGFTAVIGKLTSGNAQVRGFKLSITKNDEAFVPQTEKIEIEYTVDDTGGAAKKGRYEIWGERYPTNKPLYTENFTPANGARSWKTWDGKANAGILSAKYITPEFSPYRLRIVIGPDQAGVDDEFGAGLARVAAVEKQFEVRFQSIEVRLQAAPANAVKNALGMNAGQIPTLVVEPRHDKGAFAVTNRLPMKTEPAVALGWAGGGEGGATGGRDGIGRIRIAGKRHTQIGDSLNQGYSNAGDPVSLDASVWLHRLTDGYMSPNDAPLAGPGSTKYDIEKTLYKRPEIPVELVAKLRSRDTVDVTKKRDGLFSKEAVGPALFDVFAEDTYAAWLYDGGAGPVTIYNQARTYFKNAALKVKWGAHNTPEKSGTDPVISHWQQRFVITADGQEEVGDTTEAFQKTKTELTVYLNRTRLTRDDDATADNAKTIKLDYAETSDKKIKLRKGLAMTGDVVWIIRTPDAALNYTAVADWAAFPPGDNCHTRYGGIRGVAPADDLAGALRKDFSAPLAGSFPYTAANAIDLDPDKVAAAKRERVESQAVTTDGDQKGLAGAIFSPSTMAGDKYVIEGRLRERPYLRDLGWVADRPVAWDVRGRGGTMVVWRLLTISASWRMSLKPHQRDLAVGVGEDDPDVAGRLHPGNGRNMNFVQLNKQGEQAFTEWLILKADGSVAGREEEAHQNVDLDAYRQFFNAKATANEAGFYDIPNTAAITNYCVRWDHYRVTLPPGIPANRRRVATKAIESLPKGTTSVDAAVAVFQAITDWNVTHGGDRLLASLAGAPIPISGLSPAQYEAWVDSKVTEYANEYMDTIMPQIAAPDRMRTLRWPDMYPAWIWSNGDPAVVLANCFINLGTAGYCRGSGQAFFFSLTGNPDTFEHEMGHSLFLIHFAAGSVANFGWKHHDLNYQTCLMGYNSGAFKVPLPAAHVGANVTITTTPRSWMCPKCLMKLRGWDEILLPCHWTHPDVF
jgi:hypothetical protein